MTGPIDPDQYIITRKRKKYRFAKFALADNCYEFDQWLKFQGRSLEKVHLEIGAGTGLFSLELARRYPDKLFVALDVKADRLQKGAYQAIDDGISNIYFVRARADQIDQMFAANSLDAVWITFPDPFPRTRSAGRRLTHPNFLERYASLLSSGGELLLKHDNSEFFDWSLEQLVGANWQIKGLSFDLHESELNDDYKIMTTYERRWLSEGRRTKFVRATVGQSGGVG